VIDISHLYKVYGEVRILEDINLLIDHGECVVLRGVSGSGKTTLLSLIAGLEKPTSGSVLIDGDPIHKLPDLFASTLRATKIGMIFQHFNLIEHLSVEENVMVPLIPLGLSLESVQERVHKALKLANIEHKANHFASRLSGGEKQRTAIARALVNDPAIILCDEPTANLDRANALVFIEMLQSLHTMGKTLMIATHDPLFEKLEFEHRTIPMVQGSIVDG